MNSLPSEYHKISWIELASHYMHALIHVTDIESHVYHAQKLWSSCVRKASVFLITKQSDEVNIEKECHKHTFRIKKMDHVKKKEHAKETHSMWLCNVFLHNFWIFYSLITEQEINIIWFNAWIYLSLPHSRLKFTPTLTCHCLWHLSLYITFWVPPWRQQAIMLKKVTIF